MNTRAKNTTNSKRAEIIGKWLWDLEQELPWHTDIKTADIQKMFGVSRSSAFWILKYACEAGVLIKTKHYDTPLQTCTYRLNPNFQPDWEG